MIINHNMSALNTYRQMSINEANTQKSLQKLSSGLRINGAADDAAGLAISEKMRGQIRGLDQASRNAQDGISLLQTAEGALNETHSILQRMRELAVQASSDTNNADDRNAIQKEVDQLKTEIDRIGNSTEFNTKKLLNGQAGVISNAQNGTVGATTDITVDGTTNPAAINLTATELGKAISSVTTGAQTKAGVYNVVITAQATAAKMGDAAAGAALTADATLSVNGVAVSLKNGDTLADVVLKINNVSAQTGVTASVGSTNGGLKLTSNALGSDAKIDVSSDNATLKQLGLTAGTEVVMSVAGTDATGTINGQTASGHGNTLTLNKYGDAADGLTVNIGGLTVAAGKQLAFKASVDSTNSLTLQIGANNSTEQQMSVSINDMRAKALNVDQIKVTDTLSAQSAITTIDNAIKTVSSERANIGAYQNRLEHTINNLGTSSENLTAAESRIRDVDMAKEMMNFQKNNILQQAAQAMLAQANQQPQGVLQLLR